MSDENLPPEDDLPADDGTSSAAEPARQVPTGIRIFPNVWPGEPLQVQPGDVTQFAPMGFCFGGPTIMRPWDTLESSLAARDYYGAQSNGFHPLHDAPRTEPSGGVLYFDSGSGPDKVLSALELMHLPSRMNEYAVFVSEATDPQKDGFLVHCRMMPFGTLSHLYRADIGLIEGGATPQPMNLGDFVRGFLKVHEDRYGTGMSGELRGAMGGDGDWAKESLCFGFMMENPYHGICRLWSRAWLVTK